MIYILLGAFPWLSWQGDALRKPAQTILVLLAFAFNAFFNQQGDNLC